MLKLLDTSSLIEEAKKISKGNQEELVWLLAAQLHEQQVINRWHEKQMKKDIHEINELKYKLILGNVKEDAYVVGT